MIVTSRFAALVFAVTVLVAVGVRSWGALLAVDVALLALAVLDVALAGAVRPLHLSRTGATSTRLGEPVTVTLTVRNAGRRTVRGQVRDAWVPSAGARVTRHRLDVAADRITRIDTHLVPSRRGERNPDRVTVRSLGPLRLAGRQGSHRVPWAVRVLPAFPSRKHLPSRLARLRELDGRTAVMVRGQGTEFDSLREYVAGDDVRTAGGPGRVHPGRNGLCSCAICQSNIAAPAGWGAFDAVSGLGSPRDADGRRVRSRAHPPRSWRIPRMGILTQPGRLFSS